MTPQSPPQPFWRAMALAWQFGFTIAVPLVVLALAGRFADRHFKTSPWLLLTGIVLSIAVSSILIIRKTATILKDVENEHRNIHNSTPTP